MLGERLLRALSDYEIDRAAVEFPFTTNGIIDTSLIAGGRMRNRLEDLMSDLGRGVRRFVGGLDASAREAGAALTGAAPEAPPIERTDDGLYRIGGFLFTTEKQALDFAERRQRRFAPREAAVPPTTQIRAQPDEPPAAAPRNPQTRIVSPAERELMAAYGIELADNGFRAAGYVFTSLDQAIGWARRRQNPSSPSAGPRLMSHAHTGGIQVPSAPPPSRAQISDVLRRSSTPRASYSAKTQSIRWLSEPTTLSFGGLTIAAEMIFVGKVDRYDFQSNNALIDPTLKVGTTGDPYGTTLGYWPSYSRLDPRARRSYLEWLNGGRQDPDAPIGFVFLFFYGLEYRLLKDGVHEDASAILHEVRRLFDLYGHHPSFRRYATALIEVAELLAGDAADELVPTAEIGMRWEMPLNIRVALGRKVGNGEALTAGDALTWVLASPETYLRTPAQRCFAELCELWGKRFRAAYPDGFKVEPPKARIKHFYRAASANFTADIAIEGLPDVSGLQGPVKRFRTLLERCVEDLDAYSRFLGRNPDKRQSIAAAILLPVEIQDGQAGQELRSRRQKLADLIDAATPPRTGDILELLDLEVPAAGAKVPLGTTRQMGALLDLMDAGFEPDRRYGASSAMTTDTKMVLFHAEGGAKVEADEPAFVAGRTMAEIAALAAVSDGVAVPIELESICRDLASLPALGTVERERLAAHAAALLHDPPKRKEATKRLAALPETVRQRILQSAVAAILADGRVLPAEVRFLEGLHTTLGLPQEDVYAALHRASVSDDQPVTVAAEERTAGVPLPSRPAAAGVIEIDVSRLDRIRSETLEVSELLADIFVEEAEPTVARPVAQAASRFERLDAAHAELLWRVILQPVPFEEFETHARTVRLLPEGAIETINEWGFETLDEPVIELEELVYVHEHLVDQLRTMGEQA